MEIVRTKIHDVLILKPKIHKDSRGYFMESFRKDVFEEKAGPVNFVQENESYSVYGVLRGLHYQKPPFAQGKLVRVIEGEVLDVAVDLRVDSNTFGQYVAVELTSENKHQLWIPRGFAHGFVVLSKTALFSYKCDNYYAPLYDSGLKWDDEQINIDWRVPSSDLIVSEKDKAQSDLESIRLSAYFKLNHT